VGLEAPAAAATKARLAPQACRWIYRCEFHTNSLAERVSGSSTRRQWQLLWTQQEELQQKQKQVPGCNIFSVQCSFVTATAPLVKSVLLADAAGGTAAAKAAQVSNKGSRKGALR
jgi:hypothetical protein